MAIPVLYGKDVKQTVLNDKTVAVLGYGNQGHAHALNLRDAGVNVIVGQRAGRMLTERLPMDLRCCL